MSSLNEYSDTLNRVVVYNSRLTTHSIIKQLPFTNVKFSDSMLFDILFPACSPSLAISLFEENDSRTIQDKAKLVSDIQSTKNNYFVLCVFPNMDSSHWYDFQNLIEPGTARIIKLNTFTEVVDAIITCHANMSDSYKLHLQSEYFANKRKEFQSSSTVKAILLTVASKLGISEDEIVIVLEAFPTISRIIRASKEELMNTCPIDNTSIDKLFHYFHGQNDS